MRQFSAACHAWAVANRAVKRAPGNAESVFCFPVALVQSADDKLRADLHGTCPPKHFATAEFPVLYERLSGRLTWYAGTPLWGAAYYAGFRRDVERYLT